MKKVEPAKAIWYAVCFSLLTNVAFAWEDSSDLLQLKIVDEGGHAVEKAKIGWDVRFQDDAEGWPASRLSRLGYARSDSSGRVHLATEDLFGKHKNARALYVLQSKQQLVGIHVVAAVDDLTMIQPVTVHKACRVSFPLDRDNFEIRNQDELRCELSIFRGEHRLLTHTTETNSIDCLLPPGKYSVEAYLWDGLVHSQLIRRELHVPSKPSLKDTPLAFVPDRLSTLLGKEAPQLTLSAWTSKTRESPGPTKGKVTLLYFWSTGCAPCVAFLPKLIELHTELAEDGLQIISIHAPGPSSSGELSAQCKKWTRGQEIPFELAVDQPGNGGTHYVSGKTAGRYGAQAWPTTLLVDRNGVLVKAIGSLPHDELITELKKLLNENDEVEK